MRKITTSRLPTKMAILSYLTQRNAAQRSLKRATIASDSTARKLTRLSISREQVKIRTIRAFRVPQRRISQQLRQSRMGVTRAWRQRVGLRLVESASHPRWHPRLKTRNWPSLTLPNWSSSHSSSTILERRLSVISRRQLQPCAWATHRTTEMS